MINQIELYLLAQYDCEKFPSHNYRLLLILLAGGKHANPALSMMIEGATNNAVTRLRGEFHWLVHFEDGDWWLDERHLPINGKVCFKVNARASAEAYLEYATKSKKQAESEAERVPKANHTVQKAVIVKQEVFAE